MINQMYIDISVAFQDRSHLQINTCSYLERIASAYKCATDVDCYIDPNYRVSREWVQIYEEHLGETIANLKSFDLKKIELMYNNFFRHKCSSGLHGLHFQMVETYMNPGMIPPAAELARYLESCRLYAELLLISMPHVSLSEVEKPIIGNPYGYEIVTDDHRYFLQPCTEYHYHYSHKIRMLLDKFDYPSVLELGGGFGGLAYFLIKNVRNLKYIGIDLPENIALQTYYLTTTYPEKRFLLADDEHLLSRLINEDFDIALLPSQYIESMPSNSVNLSFNSYSLAEMSKSAADNYITQLSRISSGYIYHINHTRWAVSADDFNVDRSKFELMFRFPTMWGRDPIHPELDHHDYLYRRLRGN